MVAWRMQYLFTSRLCFLEGKRTITVIKASRQNASTRIFASKSRQGNMVHEDVGIRPDEHQSIRDVAKYQTVK
ncbi:hypothetical protein SDC9_99292 [bioreactor metagenome]|uniref:Uncharacterized protein n=1 Tax=bioreactor metagenome TaxID=1076179 RepID=A0A645AH45_9ZZZZ